MAKAIHLTVAMALVMAVVLACRRSPPVQTDGAAPSTGRTAEPTRVPTAPTVQGTESPPVEVAASESRATPADGQTPPSSIAATPGSAPPAALPAPAPIVGDAPVPPTGKPVAAVAVAWDLQPDPAHPGRYQGTVTARNLAGTARVLVRGETLGAAALLSPPQVDQAAVERNGILVLPIVVQVRPEGEASLLVTTQVIASSTRSRIIRIPLQAPPPPAEGSAPASGTAPAGTTTAPPTGEHVLIDAGGQPVHFMPAAGQP